METSEFINPKLITEIIADMIRKDIETDVLKPGDRVGEEKISKKYKISRTPVREAFRILETEGYLSHSPRCGVIVRTVEKKEIEEIFEIRAWNEQLMVRKIVEGLNTDIIHTLKALRAEMIALMSEIKEDEFRQTDSTFHEVLVSNCSNKKLGETIKGLKVSTRLIRTKAGFSPERAKASLEECCNLIDRILEKDAENAAALMKIHFDNSLAFFLEHYPMS